MAGLFLLAVGVQYIVAGLLFIKGGQYGMGIAFIFYAGANVGLFLAARNI